MVQITNNYLEMTMDNKLVYTLHLFNSSCDKDFLAALDIYQNNIIRQEKTPMNEICWVVENSSRFKKSSPYIFGIKLNNEVIGYAETAYIPSAKSITIDYLILDDKYNTHSAFYTFLLLIIEYYNSHRFDYDYIITEKLTYNDTQFVDEMSEWQLEGFKVVNQMYIQPKLEVDNYDSEHEAILMLYQRNTDSPCIGKETYKKIVAALYFDYYYEWDSFFFKSEDESVDNYNRLKQNLQKIEEALNIEEIKLNGYPFKKISNESKIIPKDTSSSKKAWKALLFVATLCIVALGVILAIKKMNIELAIVGIIFILITFLWLSVMALSDEKAFKIIEKIPLLSKFFGQSK